MKAKMEVVRTYLKETTGRHHQASIAQAVEPSGRPEKGKAKGNMEKVYGERQRPNVTNMIRIGKDVQGQKETEIPCLWPVS